ncbi:hypothetical protein, partial [Nitrosomonas sp. Nm33]|uniref:hypothetical protein n=1 Tax=Nitrosomonas sp. Nm33 TaxID=133724 RepID=UPI001C409901
SDSSNDETLFQIRFIIRNSDSFYFFSYVELTLISATVCGKSHAAEAEFLLSDETIKCRTERGSYPLSRIPYCLISW